MSYSSIALLLLLSIIASLVFPKSAEAYSPVEHDPLAPASGEAVAPIEVEAKVTRDGIPAQGSKVK